MRSHRHGNRDYVLPMIISIPLVAAVVGTIWYFSEYGDPKLDVATYCPVEQGLTKQSIFFLLDTTQRLSATQEQLIQRIFYRVIDAAQGYDRIEIFEVDPAENDLLQPLFNYCKPVSTDLGDPLVQKFQESRFKRMLKKYFDSREFKKPTSPIIGAIGSVAASFPSDNSSRHLIIASDFIENSNLLNQYDPHWRNEIDANPKPIYDRQPRLEEVDVSLLFIPRPDVKHHDQEFADWWMKYLEDSGANVTEQQFYDPVGGHRYDLDPFIPITG